MHVQLRARHRRPRSACSLSSGERPTPLSLSRGSFGFDDGSLSAIAALIPPRGGVEDGDGSTSGQGCGTEAGGGGTATGAWATCCSSGLSLHAGDASRAAGEQRGRAPRSVGEATARGAIALSRLPSPERLLAQAFARVAGGCGDDEHDVLVLRTTVEVAKVVCFGLQGCRGFTYWGPETKRQVVVHFKANWGPSGGALGSRWTSYRFEPSAAAAAASCNFNTSSEARQEEQARRLASCTSGPLAGPLWSRPTSPGHRPMPSPLRSPLGASAAAAARSGSPTPASLGGGFSPTPASLVGWSPSSTSLLGWSPGLPAAAAASAELLGGGGQADSFRRVYDARHALALQWQCQARCYLARRCCVEAQTRARAAPRARPAMGAQPVPRSHPVSLFEARSSRRTLALAWLQWVQRVLRRRPRRAEGATRLAEARAEAAEMEAAALRLEVAGLRGALSSTQQVRERGERGGTNEQN